jgi:HlyD family secretion protein
MRRSIALLALAATLAACGGAPEQTYQGWIEADLVFVGPDEAGRVEQLSVREGETVAAGAPLFTLEDELQKADVFAAEAALANAKQAFERAQQLAKTGSGTQAAFDTAQAAQREAEARLNSARTRLARRKVASPVSGSVQQLYFRPGELVTAGRPIVALLPPGNMKVRFYVPEGTLPKIAVGDTVQVRCDGCPDDLSARISFIARAAEYTPPVIYSLEERAKLVFLVEARPQHPERLRVGQPVSVAVLPRGAAQ